VFETQNVFRSALIVISFTHVYFFGIFPLSTVSKFLFELQFGLFIKRPVWLANFYQTWKYLYTSF